MAAVRSNPVQVPDAASNPVRALDAASNRVACCHGAAPHDVKIRDVRLPHVRLPLVIRTLVIRTLVIRIPVTRTPAIQTLLSRIHGSLFPVLAALVLEIREPAVHGVLIRGGLILPGLILPGPTLHERRTLHEMPRTHEPQQILGFRTILGFRWIHGTQRCPFRRLPNERHANGSGETAEWRPQAAGILRDRTRSPRALTRRPVPPGELYDALVGLALLPSR